ncbi:MAG TPA: hypothetical protein VHU40_10160, partial [Polyangia bacterium]|nr:hypothetical protein [Polyangia bacterium]
MAMTRARWGLAGALALAALIVGVKAFAAYVTVGSTVGVVAMLALLAVLVVGLGSLARARRDLARELRALGASTPSGALYAARRKQLEDLAARNVTPELDALSAAVAAAENERGYAGRYLVATTVLVGLVGTFGGLMETLGRLPPLLTGEGNGTLALLAGPLQGLHVTFGTSLVAILITLALSLVQGDVTLNQERLLALLEERTRHVLMPALFPPTETAAERTAREVAGLRAELAKSFTAAAATSAAEFTKVVRGEIQRLVTEVGAELRASATTQTKALQEAAGTMAGAIETTTRALGEDGRANRARLEEMSKLVAGELSSGLRETNKAASALFERSAASMSAAVAGVTSSFEQSANRLNDTVGVATSVLADASREAAADLRATLGRTHEGLAAELRATAQASAEALAASMRDAREALIAAAAESRAAWTASATESKEALAAAAIQSKEALVAASVESRDALTRAVLESTRAATLAAEQSRDALTNAVAESTRALAASAAETKESLVSSSAE